MRSWLPFVGLMLFSVGCSTAYIPNTDVEDNAQNRRVISFCEDYRHAIEDKNITRLLAMASPQYHDDASTPSGSDDIDYEGLRGFLTGLYQHTSQIRYEIKYKRVTFSESGHVWVDYIYAASYKLPGLKGDEWRHSVSDNRLDLVADGDGFKIVTGM
jgi:hypothetical protein